MNILQIQYFLEVCRTKNFTSAAEHMHISQPSFSRQIHLLEEEIGAPLLIRDNRRVTLTHVGEVFFREFEPLIIKMQDAYEKVKQEAIPKKELCVGIFHPLRYNVLSLFLDNLQKYYEGYQLELIKCQATDLQTGYLNGEFDVILTNNVINLKLQNACSAIIAHTQAVVAMSSSLADELKEPFSFWQLDGKKLICMDEYSAPGLSGRYREIAEKLNIHVGEVAVRQDILAPLFVGEPGNGFTFYTREDMVESDKICYVEIPREQYQFEIIAWWNKNNPQHLNKFFEKHYKND